MDTSSNKLKKMHIRILEQGLETDSQGIVLWNSAMWINYIKVKINSTQ